MKFKKEEVKKQSKTRAKEQRETEYESFGISLGRERVCVNSKYYRERERERERERDERELLKMLDVEKKAKESVIYKLRTESGVGGGGPCGYLLCYSLPVASSAKFPM